VEQGAADMPYLIMSKDCKGYRVVRFSDSVTIGRAEENDIVLNDTMDMSVSRHHAYIEQVGDRHILRDQSKNGTFVDDERIEKFPLSHGVTFQIMGYLFTFIDDTAAEQVTPRAGRPGGGLSEEETGIETLVPRGEETDRDRAEKEAIKGRLLQEGIVVDSEKMVRLYRDVHAVAGINVPLLILGEPGSGKEHIAHAIHNESKAKGNFIALNCSSIPEGLFESELFGSVKGAFNSAVDKPGKLELADRGTIFLDEIGDMSLSLQPKLLRFIEDHEITRLGDTKTRKVTVRVVAATNQDLKVMMERNTFRQDFYQRLACIKLEVPPLRERKEEIEPLAEFFLSRFSKEQGLEMPSLSASAVKLLADYHWPGNIRELRNVLLGAMVQVGGKTIYPRHLCAVSEELRAVSKRPAKPVLTMEEIEKQHIWTALTQVNWNKTEASRLLGISRDTLYKKLAKYKIPNDSSPK
jgi:transcriptional regulator with PAS, ATPase and Fis domain